MKKVSVLMPVYNVERYIIEAVESIVNQTYSNIELVIIDDASTDNTRSLLNELHNKYYNIIKLVINDRNMGISKSLNKGLLLCEGDYIARADGDDIQALDRIQRQVDYLENNSDVCLVGCWIKNIDEQGNEIANCEYPSQWSFVKESLKYSSPVLHIWMATKEIYKKLGGYRNTNPAEDYDFILRCIDLGFKVSNLRYYGAYIRLRSGGTITESSLKQRVTFEYLQKVYFSNEINSDNVERNIPETYNHFLIRKLHNYSIYFLKRGLEQKKTLKGKFFVVLSLISPYTTRDILRRRKFRKLMLEESKLR
ncbi:glycosyltransferase family 2 protein [Enterobacter sp.]|uniref:glycosyltransferase family 2 protein n=1 Tax=Enterobacter sp. TaxID=42895 RepID=UPI00296EFC69|nr:glycosyltransferase [Enterobacter sp.]